MMIANSRKKDNFKEFSQNNCYEISQTVHRNVKNISQRYY